ncbi:hypothetical protein CCACVL1_27076, partial [Corchorus capsularis]
RIETKLASGKALGHRNSRLKKIVPVCINKTS